MFKKESFEGRDCLDIGCNQGIVTNDVAKKISCMTILGIEIDGLCISPSICFKPYWTIKFRTWTLHLMWNMLVRCKLPTFCYIMGSHTNISICPP